MDKLCKIICFSLVGLAALLFIAFSDLVNPPIDNISEQLGTVIGGEFFPQGRGSGQELPKIRIKRPSGEELLLNQTGTDKFHYGDTVRVVTWKRRFWGYKTMVEPQ
jgi:hypothetical protein